MDLRSDVLKEIKVRDLEAEHLTKLESVLGMLDKVVELKPNKNLAFLAEIYLQEKMKGRKAKRSALKEIEAIIISAQSSHNIGSEKRADGAGDKQKPTEHFLSAVRGGGQESLSIGKFVEKLASWWQAGEIKKMSINVNLNGEKEKDALGELMKSQEHPLIKILQPTKAAHDFESEAKKGGFDEYFSTDPGDPIVITNKRIGTFTSKNQGENNQVLVLPVITTRTVEETKKGGLFGMGKKTETKSEGVEDPSKKIVALSLLSTRTDDFGRTGGAWQIQCICSAGVAQEIFESLKTVTDLFNFFADVAPLFLKIECENAEDYLAKIKEIKPEAGLRRISAESMEKFNNAVMTGM